MLDVPRRASELGLHQRLSRRAVQQGAGGGLLERQAIELGEIIGVDERPAVLAAANAAADPTLSRPLDVHRRQAAAVAEQDRWPDHFDTVADKSRHVIAVSEQAGRLARDAYTYIHIPIIAGIVAVAVGDNLVLAYPTDRLGGVGAATVVAGPALFLLGPCSDCE